MKTLKPPRYTYLKQDIYYFTRAVPVDLRQHYARSRIIKSLRTKSHTQAKIASNHLSTKLEAYWFTLRLSEIDVPRGDLLVDASQLNSNLPTITEALDQYLQVKGREKDQSFARGARRNIGYLAAYVGSKSLDQYTTSDAAKLRDHLLEKGLQSTSLQRIFGSIKAILNFVINENGYDCKNPFTGIYIPSGGGVKRRPIPVNEIRVLQQTCMDVDDDIRRLVALISDTGMRLAEAAGLRKTDITLDGEVPYVYIRPHNHRRLKTESSKRKIPLVGCSLWAANQLANQTDEYCFPRYTNHLTCNSNSASATINKWIKTIANDRAVAHGFRHSFRDRLRKVQAPTDMIDQLGGWSHKSVGQNYGDGYDLNTMHKWLKEIELG